MIDGEPHWLTFKPSRNVLNQMRSSPPLVWLQAESEKRYPQTRYSPIAIGYRKIKGGRSVGHVAVPLGDFEYFVNLDPERHTFETYADAWAYGEFLLAVQKAD